MYKILLLIILNATGEPAIAEGPNAKLYSTIEECRAQIRNEVDAAQLLIDSNLQIEKDTLTVKGGRCFSEDEINKLRGGQSATEKNLHANFVRK